MANGQEHVAGPHTSSSDARVVGLSAGLWVRVAGGIRVSLINILIHSGPDSDGLNHAENTAYLYNISQLCFVYQLLTLSCLKLKILYPSRILSACTGD